MLDTDDEYLYQKISTCLNAYNLDNTTKHFLRRDLLKMLNSHKVILRENFNCKDAYTICQELIKCQKGVRIYKPFYSFKVDTPIHEIFDYIEKWFNISIPDIMDRTKNPEPKFIYVTQTKR